MDQRSGSNTPRQSTGPRNTSNPRTISRPNVDKFPKDLAQWAAFAVLPAEARSAVYLRSIRAMLLFFTVLTILGIIAGVILTLVGIHAVDQATTTTNPLG